MNTEAWSADALWQKSKQFMRTASSATTEPARAFWCSLALEMLARAALASIHPALLAEYSKNEPEHLLFAFGGPLPKKGAKSIGFMDVLLRLRSLRGAEFLDDHVNLCAKFAHARNEELHSGTLGFENFAKDSWRRDFYQVAQPLIKILNRKPSDLYGKHEAKVATKLLEDADHQLVAKVKKMVAGRRSLFEAKPIAEQKSLRVAADQKAERMALTGGHRVTCPACGSKANIFGVVSATSDPQLEDDKVTVRQTILPNRFKCSACGLAIASTAGLQVEKLANPYTRTTQYSPWEYYYDDDADDDEDYEEYNND